MKSNKTKLILITLLSIFVFALLVFLYYFSFRIVIDQILDRGDSDTENLFGLIGERDSVDDAINYFDKNRDLEIIVVDADYQIMSSTATYLRTQYFSNNITFAKSQGIAYSLIKRDVGKTLSLVYSKSGNYNDNQIVVSIEYPFLSYEEFRRTVITLIVLILIIMGIDTYLITTMYLNEYIYNLNKFVKNKHLYNEFNSTISVNPLNDNLSSEVSSLLKTLNRLKKRYDSILDNDRERISKINSFLSNAPAGILIIDKDREISLMNDMVNDLFKIKKSQILHPYDIESLDEIYLIWDIVCQNRKIIVEDIKLRNKIIEIEAIPLNDKYSPFEFIGVLFILRDVTKTREIANIKDEFVSNVSHEIRTPLTIISGFAQALENENIKDEDKKICINSINEEVKKLTNLTNELLQISKIEKGVVNENYEIFNPFEVVKNQVALLINKALEKNIKIHIDLESNNNCSLNTNLVYFRQIISNLLDNAIKYSLNDTIIEISEYVKDEFYFISIKDNGIGIDEESIERIFERFYRVEKSRNSEIAGSGLGLSIVKLFIDVIGGEIKVDSEINKGSTFTVKIKRYESE